VVLIGLLLAWIADPRIWLPVRLSLASSISPGPARVFSNRTPAMERA